MDESLVPGTSGAFFSSTR